jgi:chaperone required for assembly of F1-ATPase
MSAPALKRFYKTVTVAARPEGFAILLDERPVKTPARTELRLPTPALAEAVAEEWRAQAEKIIPDSMKLTKLAYTAIDRVGPLREDVVEQVVAFGRTDLLCYRASAPSDLVERQNRVWGPLLDWAKSRFGLELQSGEGIVFIEQPAASLEALARHVSAQDDFQLAGLHTAATITGSVVLALAIAEGYLDADAAFATAELDATYQAEIWGEDWEAKARTERRHEELAATARYLALLRS